MIIFQLIVQGLLIVLAFPAGYLLLCTIGAYLFRKEIATKNKFLNIGVLISAHNEEEGIAHTIRR